MLPSASSCSPSCHSPPDALGPETDMGRSGDWGAGRGLQQKQHWAQDCKIRRRIRPPPVPQHKLLRNPGLIQPRLYQSGVR
eukprot:163363-Alexandrium_andersonii.AAC.1